MLSTTRAVVLRTFKHGDRGTVLKAYTEAFGARSYFVRGGGRKSPVAALLQPLNRLELVVTETHERELHAVRELRVERPYTRVHADHARGLLLLFAQEVLCRTLREEAPDAALFAFVQRDLEAIDVGEDLAHAPLRLLAGLAAHLGIAPEPPRPGQDRFDLREGHFFSGPPPHDQCMDTEVAFAFARLLQAERAGMPPSIAPVLRLRLLEHLLLHFRLHVAGFGELRSPEVLHALLH
ncbi:MAG: DNA repair protein RecO [Bacteroidetes bacterium]|nr:DNA repair protein RecO [Bacteroidota bacterium]